MASSLATTFGPTFIRVTMLRKTPTKVCGLSLHAATRGASNAVFGLSFCGIPRRGNDARVKAVATIWGKRETQFRSVAQMNGKKARIGHSVHFHFGVLACKALRDSISSTPVFFWLEQPLTPFYGKNVGP
jgi:hypothetical protein